MDCSIPNFPALYYLLEFAQTHVHWVSDATQPSDPWSPSSPVLNIPQHQIFLPLSWLFTSGGIRLSKEYSGLIYFRIDWFNLLAVQGTLKSLLHHHSSNASIIWRSAFFTVQLSHPYITTGKTIALTRQGVAKSRTGLSDWTELNFYYSSFPMRSQLLIFEESFEHNELLPFLLFSRFCLSLWHSRLM